MLRSENSQLKSQMEAKDIMLENKDGEILRLLNQIASDMVKRSDVDEIVKNAVAEEHDRMVDYYEGKLKSMAAEYEAKIAELQTSKRRKNTDGNSGASGSRRVSKSDTLTFDTKEEALAALDAAQKKLKSMTDQAFGGGGEMDRQIMSQYLVLKNIATMVRSMKQTQFITIFTQRDVMPTAHPMTSEPLFSGKSLCQSSTRS